jgi:molecular chaperone DnaK
MSVNQILSKAIGIDLGTTNSAVAIMNAADSDIILHKDASKSLTTPSVVWKDPKDKAVMVGKKAYSRIGSMPSPLRSLKRHMGSQRKFLLTDEEILPEQFSAYVLKEMKRQIQDDLPQMGAAASSSWRVDRAIVTVTAYFEQNQIDATRRAAEQAGLQVVDLLHEPTAAACYHCWKTGTQNGLFLVYDLGGGTFDVSIVRVTAGQFEVLGISGNNQLGGDDFDVAIAEYLLGELQKEEDSQKEKMWALDLDFKDQEDRLRFDRLKLLAETAKKALSNADDFLLRDTQLTDKKGQRVSIERQCERADIEKVIRPIAERTIAYCWEALEKAKTKAKVSLSQVDGIILAGGSTHVPLVRALVQETFCAQDGKEGRAKCASPIYESVDTLVALGAAIRAAAVGGLSVYDNEERVRVSFRGTGNAGSSSTRAAGNVEVLKPGINVEGGTIRLRSGDHEEETDLKAGGAFVFKQIPLKPNVENLLEFEVYDGSGNLVAAVSRPVSHNEEAAARPTGGASSTAVLSKPLMLEIRDAGRLVKETLVKELQSLPFEVEHRFRHPGNTALIVLPVFQLQRKIQEIKVQVEASLPAGTPVVLRVHIDEAYRMTVHGKIGDSQTFEALVEVPDDPAVPQDDQIKALEKNFLEQIGYLGLGERAVAEEKWARANEDFQKARHREDDPGAIHSFEEMLSLVAAVEAPPPLDPPKHEFDKLVKECLEINQHVSELAQAVSRPHDPDEIRKSIETHRAQGETAFGASDQRIYAEAIGGLERIKIHLINLLKSMLPPDVGPSDEDRARYLVNAIQEEAESLANRARAQKKNDIAAQAETIKTAVASLKSRAGTDAPAVLRELQGHRVSLERLANALKSFADGGKHVEK